MLLLNDEGTLYYFSTAKDRDNLFNQGVKVKFKVTKIDMNKDMATEYSQFKHEDNIYYLYTIQKS